MSSSSSLEASLFAQISSQETLNKLLRRLKAIGSAAKEFSVHESVFKPVEGSCIAPPVPSMKPVMRVPIRESVSTAYPIENGFWIIQLGSECENVQVLAERDTLLHEIGKIFDDLFELKHLENRLFAA